MRRMLLLATLAALVGGTLAGEAAAAAAESKTGVALANRIVWSPDRLIKVTGALPKNFRIRVLKGRQIPRELRGEDSRVGKVYDLEPDGLRFRRPVTITRWLGGFDPALGLPELFQFSRGARARWTPLAKQSIAFDGKRVRVTGTTRHLSNFAVLDGGARFELVPTPVVKAVNEVWNASIVFDTDRFGHHQIGGTAWTAAGAVDFVAPPLSFEQSAQVKCTEVGPGTYKVNADVADNSFAQAVTNLVLVGVPQGGIAGKVLLLGKATCVDGPVPTCPDPAGCSGPPTPPSCSQGLGIAPTTHEGQPVVQLTGQCDGYFPAGLDNAGLDAPAGTQIFEYWAHSTSCSLSSIQVTCKVKPDGRICIIVRFGSAVPAGTNVRVRLGKADGTLLVDQTFTLGATEESTCSTGL